MWLICHIFLLSSSFINKILLSLALEKPTFSPTKSPDSALYNKNKPSGKLQENWKIQLCNSSYPQWMHKRYCKKNFTKVNYWKLFTYYWESVTSAKRMLSISITSPSNSSSLLLYLNKVLMGFSVGSKYCMKLLVYVGLELWHWLFKKKEVSNSLENFWGGFWTRASFFIFNLLSSLECYNHQLYATIHQFSIAN